MNKTTRYLAGMWLCAPLMAAQAQVLNGGFEAGLSGWSTLGDASAFTLGSAPAGVAQLWLTTASPAFEDDFPAAAGARNRSGSAAAEAAEVEAFLGLAAGALDPDALNAIQATEGSAAFQMVNANAGELLNFQWDFGTSEGEGADYAFLIVDGAITRLANPGEATLPGTFDNNARTGYASFSTAFLTNGPHVVGFGVVDVSDYNVTSTLAIDSVQISAVPEMPALVLGLAGLAVLGGLRQFRRSNCAAARRVAHALPESSALATVAGESAMGL